MTDWKRVMVSSELTVLQVIERIDSTGLQIAIVVDSSSQLLGTITDGDIRRGILKGISLQNPVTDIMNRNPVTARIGDSRKSIFNKMKKKRLKQIPILNEHNQVIRMDHLDQFYEKRIYTNPVVLMAGGLGTRLRPLTDNCPKPLLRLGDKPILEMIIENFIEFGFYKFFISVNYHAEMIEDYFGDGSKWGVEIEYIHETQRLGTAGALSYLKEKHLTESFFVMNGDLLTKVNFEQLLEYHIQNESIGTMCVREHEYQIPYGVVTVNEHKLLSIEEKPKQRFFINGGLYVLHPNVLEYIPKDKYYDMPELFNELIIRKEETSVFPIREYWIDIGKMDDFRKANVDVEAGII
ncbi:nucleotidyltransferase family protein [Paenibacillus aquistagni]|uniref:CBS domain-containing protein n=1 Tax=Paenibacillus aquistagni TaxID=1852522 RepID=A0A1X7KXS1_9BACL|nr:nucleotidyltransferase family protein [Paenibacillus aquistagni]SMG46230.1 CBS domain-containing protein [Paenibacillus aquistagni]